MSNLPPSSSSKKSGPIFGAPGSSSILGGSLGSSLGGSLGSGPVASSIGSGPLSAARDANVGRVTQVIGPVVDIEFTGPLPEVNTALKISNPGISDEPDNLTVEVALHLGERTVRTIAMDTTDGLVRGMEVRNTGKPIMMPVGKAVLGRILNVTGEPVDERGPVETEEYRPIHRAAPPFTEQSTKVEPFVTGIKVIDLLAPYRRGGKIGLFGGAGGNCCSNHRGNKNQRPDSELQKNSR